MRIGIDARELTGHATGVGRYLSGLLRRWAGPLGHGHEFLLYAHRAIEFPAQSPLTSFKVRVLPGSGGTAWEQLSLSWQLRADRVDAFFAPGYTAPLLSGVPTTVAVHDVSFFAHPDWFSPREGARRRFMCRRAAAGARAVITISEFSKREIIRYLGMAPGAVRVIPPGIDLPVPDAASSAHPATNDARILYVGSIFNRRNIPQLVEGTRRTIAVHPTASLDLVGDNRSRPPLDLPALFQAGAGGGRMRWHRYVSDAELSMLYASARAFAFLSDYEGLGLTPLEAIFARVPAVLLDTAVARESCGEAALYVPKGDIQETANALSAALFDESTRARLFAAAPAVLARYNWDTAARLTLAAVEGK